jgi:hypothetical protein
LLDLGANPNTKCMHHLVDRTVYSSPMEMAIFQQDEMVAPLLAKQGVCDTRLKSVDMLWRRECLLMHLVE